MKRNYIIPTTEIVAFSAGSICTSSGGASGRNVSPNIPGMGYGGGKSYGNPD